MSGQLSMSQLLYGGFKIKDGKNFVGLRLGDNTYLVPSKRKLSIELEELPPSKHIEIEQKLPDGKMNPSYLELRKQFRVNGSALGDICGVGYSSRVRKWEYALGLRDKEKDITPWQRARMDRGILLEDEARDALEEFLTFIHQKVVRISKCGSFALDDTYYGYTGESSPDGICDLDGCPVEIKVSDVGLTLPWYLQCLGEAAATKKEGTHFWCYGSEQPDCLYMFVPYSSTAWARVCEMACLYNDHVEKGLTALLKSVDPYLYAPPDFRGSNKKPQWPEYEQFLTTLAYHHAPVYPK